MGYICSEAKIQSLYKSDGSGYEVWVSNRPTEHAENRVWHFEIRSVEADPYFVIATYHFYPKHAGGHSEQSLKTLLLEDKLMRGRVERIANNVMRVRREDYDAIDGTPIYDGKDGTFGLWVLPHHILKKSESLKPQPSLASNSSSGLETWGAW